MRLLIELPLTIAFFTLAVKYGWPYTIVFVLGYILAFAIKLPFLSKRVLVSTRFLVFLGIFLAFAMTASMIIGRFFFSPNGETWIADSRIWTFLLVTPALKMLWATVIGFGLIAVVAALILLPYGYSVAQNIYSQYEQYQGHEKEAVAAAIGAFLGINRGTWIVSNGQAEVRGDPGGSLARFGGPGILIIQEGHAVILEISGKISRVVGRGITFLKPFERISMIVPLFLRSERLTVEKVATKDKVLIEEFELQAFHKLNPGLVTVERDGSVTCNEGRLCEDVWSPGGGDWRGAVRSVAETATRDVVGRYDLEEIVPISDSSRVNFKRILTEEINKVTRDKMGVTTVTVDIGKIRIPEESEARLLEKWSTQQRVQIAYVQKEVDTTHGRAIADNHRALEAARAVAQEQMILALSAGFQAAGVPDQLVPSTMIALRLLEALEKIAEDPATKMVFPSGMSLPDLQALFVSTANAQTYSANQNGQPIGSTGSTLERV